MIILIIFAFLAGLVTILSPCILPVLPIILSTSVDRGGFRRPVGVIAGFILSFTFFTLFLSTIIRLTGLPPDGLRFISILVIFLLGLTMIFPSIQVKFEAFTSTFANIVPHQQFHPGFIGGILVGISLGVLWTPCVGPILASVIALSVSEQVTFESVLITASYSLGTAIPMFVIMKGGQQILIRNPWISTRTKVIQQIFGVLMILTAGSIMMNFDRTLQTYILTQFPQYGVGLTKFENIKLVEDQLKPIAGGKSVVSIGQPMFETNQPKGKQAPELIPGGAWLNTKPLTLKSLKGSVVLIDFWTYSCINCQRTFPYLRKWWNTYKDKGLVIIGIHSPEFAFEKEQTNVAKALKDFQLSYPVMQDNDFATWKAYNNQYWPAKYLIDKEGNIRYTHFGEGSYDEVEQKIQDLLNEEALVKVTEPIKNPEYQIFTRTPELYLGYSRLQNNQTNESVQPGVVATYSAPDVLDDNAFSFIGNWIIKEESANPQKGARLRLRFDAADVYLVMRANKPSVQVKVLLDGTTSSLGEDVVNGVVTIDSDRLYKLIKLTVPGKHILELQFEDTGVELYAFSFG